MYPPSGIVMPMSETASEAARALARMRWGSQKPDRLISELAGRASELTDLQKALLRRLVDAEPVEAGRLESVSHGV